MTFGHSLIFAVRSPANIWYDVVDWMAVILFMSLALGVPLAGYVLMALDYRAYLRSLRRTLAKVANLVPATPYWVLRSRPPCLISLGLFLPITEEEVLAAYRERVKEFHPDRGGDLTKFLQLQRHLEQALHLARQHAK